MENPVIISIGDIQRYRRGQLTVAAVAAAGAAEKQESVIVQTKRLIGVRQAHELNSKNSFRNRIHKRRGLGKEL